MIKVDGALPQIMSKVGFSLTSILVLCVVPLASACSGPVILLDVDATELADKAVERDLECNSKAGGDQGLRYMFSWTEVAGKLVVTVKDKDGNAIQGATVEVVWCKPTNVEVGRSGPTATNATGKVTFDKPGNGEKSVKFKIKHDGKWRISGAGSVPQ